MDIGQRITQLKNAKGLSTNRLSAMAGISQSALRSIELGEKSPTMATVDLICDALNITIQEFFSGVVPTGTDMSLTAMTITEKTGAPGIQQNGRSTRSPVPVTTEPLDPSIERMNDPVMDGIIDNLQQMSPEERETFWRLSQSVVNRTTKGIS